MLSSVSGIDADRVVDAQQFAGVYRVEHSPSGYVYVGSSSKIDDRTATRMQSLHRFSLRPDYYLGLAQPWKALGWSRKFFNVASALPYEGWSRHWIAKFLPGTPLLDVDAAELAEIQRLLAVSPELVLNDRVKGSVPRYLHASYVPSVHFRFVGTKAHEPSAPHTFPTPAAPAAASPGIKADLPFLQNRLWSSDVRMLACRNDPDPRSPGTCRKERFPVAERVLWLCPKRVALFRAGPDGASLSGVRCDAEPSLL